MGLSGEGGDSLELNLLALLLGLSLEGGVPLDSGNELLSALGVLDVLDSEVDPLLEVSVADNLEADHSDSSGGDVVNNSGLSVVELRECVVRWWCEGKRRIGRGQRSKEEGGEVEVVEGRSKMRGDEGDRACEGWEIEARGHGQYPLSPVHMSRGLVLTLWGIPFCSAELALMSTMSPTL